MRRSCSDLPVTPLLAACALAVLLLAPTAATAQLTYTLDQTLPFGPGFDFNNAIVPIADVDGDGDLDLNPGYLYLNDGAGNFTTDGFEWGQTWFADFDGDGVLDIFRCDRLCQQGAEFWRRTGPATFSLWGTSPVGFQLGGTKWARQIGDLDGDGDADLVGRRNNSTNIWVLLSNGDGTFVLTQFQAPWPTAGVSLGDNDADGDLDLFVIPSNFPSPRDGIVYENDGSGSFTEFGPLPLPCGGCTTQVPSNFGDMNGDGFVDMIQFSGGSSYLRFGNGVDPLSQAPPVVGIFPGNVLLDVDFDGDLDSLGPSVYFNDGTGRGQGGLVLPGASGATNYGDLDGDGDFDAISGNGRIFLASGVELDSDGDGVNDADDNCPDVANPEQTDTDLDGAGDACDDDDDGDGVLDGADNCPFTPNPDQIDLDGDGLGDLCDADLDGDTVCDDPAIQINCTGGPDNCPFDPNPFQTDTDGDGAGDECDEDDDNDGVCDTAVDGAACAAGPDNCPTVANPDQSDAPDGDGIGDVCDADDDNDGANDDFDNCPLTANPDQNDTDGNGAGDACDDDDDGDGVLDGDDNCQFVANPDQADADGDFIGDACNDAYDIDGDDWADELDNCPEWPNSDQADLDGDGVGDACDPDIDGDGVGNGDDLCEGTPAGGVVLPDNGCTVEQLAPCDGPRGTTTAWKNHGKYVSAVAHATREFVREGLMTSQERDDIVSAAARSSCGK